MTILLSIRPKYAERIFAGAKLFEYRKTRMRQPIDRVIVYVTAPVSMVVGEFAVADVLCADPDSLWEATKHAAGVSEAVFQTYFADSPLGYAIEIARTQRYAVPLRIDEAYGTRPPQSFVYVPPGPVPVPPHSSVPVWAV